MADIEKLKGCPFCGNEPRTSCGYGQRGATVECLCGDCPVNTSVYIEAMRIENGGLDIDGALKSAIAAWNARTHSPLCRQGEEKKYIWQLKDKDGWCFYFNSRDEAMEKAESDYFDGSTVTGFKAANNLADRLKHEFTNGYRIVKDGDND